ncbi:MAG: hypothetical protein IJ132_00340 [Firmicutes bacterium]|nr:hypothetical protein [Bacillota bacterium]
MSVAVRFFSRSGNTKAIAIAMADAAGVSAVSVDSADAAINEKVDVLFVGGALYAYGLDSNLSEYLKALPEGIAEKAVVFSTSWISKHAIDLIKEGLAAKGIDVADEAFYVRGKPNTAKLKEAAEFAKKFI